jgi:hypothetical protein
MRVRLSHIHGPHVGGSPSLYEWNRQMIVALFQLSFNY